MKFALSQPIACDAFCDCCLLLDAQRMPTRSTSSQRQLVGEGTDADPNRRGYGRHRQRQNLRYRRQHRGPSSISISTRNTTSPPIAGAIARRCRAA